MESTPVSKDVETIQIKNPLPDWLETGSALQAFLETVAWIRYRAPERQGMGIPYLKLGVDEQLCLFASLECFKMVMGEGEAPLQNVKDSSRHVTVTAYPPGFMYLFIRIPTAELEAWQQISSFMEALFEVFRAGGSYVAAVRVATCHVPSLQYVRHILFVHLLACAQLGAARREAVSASSHA